MSDDSSIFDPTPPPNPHQARVIDLTTAFVTIALQDPVTPRTRKDLEWLVRTCFDEGMIANVMASLALGFAQQVEEIAKRDGEEPIVRWQHWCLHEQNRRLP